MEKNNENLKKEIINLKELYNKKEQDYNYLFNQSEKIRKDFSNQMFDNEKLDREKRSLIKENELLKNKLYKIPC